MIEEFAATKEELVMEARLCSEEFRRGKVETLTVICDP
jgi:hypothetical protein